MRQYLILLALISLGSGIEGGVRIEVDPSPEIGVRTDSLRISCVPDHTLSIIMVKLTKQRTPTRKSSTQNNGTDEQSQDGDANEELASGSGRLDMVVKNPNVGSAGVYTCTLHFLNTNHKMTFEKDNVTITWTESKLSDVEADVMKVIRKVALLEKNIKSSIAKKSTLRKRLAAVEKKAGTHTDKLKSLADIDTQVLASLMSIESRFLNQSGVVHHLEKIAKTRMETVQETSLKLNLLKELATKSTKQIKEKMALWRKLTDLGKSFTALEAKANITSAFSVTNRKSIGVFPLFNAFPFKDVIMNEGDDFDTQTSTYTAPCRGLYAFSLIAATVFGGHQTILELKAGQHIFGHLNIEDKSLDDQSSVSSLIRLEKGAKVRVKLIYLYGATFVRGGSRIALNGYLIQQF